VATNKPHVSGGSVGSRTGLPQRLWLVEEPQGPVPALVGHLLQMPAAWGGGHRGTKATSLRPGLQDSVPGSYMCDVHPISQA
jgi:hypothetical protein